MEYIYNNKKYNFITLLEDNENATTFKHFKGKNYKIVTIAKNTETLEDEVVYQAMYDDKKYWVRKSSMFFSKVDKEKYPDITQEYRFEKQ